MAPGHSFCVIRPSSFFRYGKVVYYKSLRRKCSGKFGLQVHEVTGVFRKFSPHIDQILVGFVFLKEVSLKILFSELFRLQVLLDCTGFEVLTAVIVS
jgi:hypothetical protein